MAGSASELAPAATADRGRVQARSCCACHPSCGRRPFLPFLSHLAAARARLVLLAWGASLPPPLPTAAGLRPHASLPLPPVQVLELAPGDLGLKTPVYHDPFRDIIMQLPWCVMAVR